MMYISRGRQEEGTERLEERQTSVKWQGAVAFRSDGTLSLNNLSREAHGKPLSS